MRVLVPDVHGCRSRVRRKYTATVPSFEDAVRLVSIVPSTAIHDLYMDVSREYVVVQIEVIDTKLGRPFKLFSEGTDILCHEPGHGLEVGLGLYVVHGCGKTVAVATLEKAIEVARRRLREGCDRLEIYLEW